jgi:hypothetical protein
LESEKYSSLLFSKNDRVGHGGTFEEKKFTESEIASSSSFINYTKKGESIQISGNIIQERTSYKREI